MFQSIYVHAFTWASNYTYINAWVSIHLLGHLEALDKISARTDELRANIGGALVNYGTISKILKIASTITTSLTSILIKLDKVGVPRLEQVFYKHIFLHIKCAIRLGLHGLDIY